VLKPVLKLVLKPVLKLMLKLILKLEEAWLLLVAVY
jgi:hypothetical protein